MKHDPPEFKADAVALHQRTGYGQPEQTGPGAAEGGADPAAPLEAENAALRKKARGVEEEREVLRKAAKRFVGETRW
ncbi:hypothetical protein AB0O86_29780 [Streptomyces hirsutus]|uniref:hypothetical protein n=1 Tax=Streptomyces hirsutus TaxID=35620 RepID=UPI00343BEE00